MLAVSTPLFTSKELDMTKYSHIVQVHPVELGEPNLSKVVLEKEFESHFNALNWVEIRNGRAEQKGEALKAVYLGCVNDATGELV
jgi:hypothetical protein